MCKSVFFARQGTTKALFSSLGLLLWHNLLGQFVLFYCYKLSGKLATFAMIKYVCGEEELVGLNNCSRQVNVNNSLPDWQESFLNFHLTPPTPTHNDLHYSKFFYERVYIFSSCLTLVSLLCFSLPRYKEVQRETFCFTEVF